MKNILIVGASGVLGHAATTYFLTKGYPVTAFVRDPGKAKDLARAGARIVRGDLTDPASFLPALEGVSVVITAAHALMGKGKNSSHQVDGSGHERLIDAAKQAGIQHFIYTSAEMASADSVFDFSRTKYAVEQYLSRSGLPYSIIRPTAFMEWHAYRLLGQKILESGKVTILGNGQARVNFIAVQDVVMAIAHLIEAGPQGQHIIELSGPDTMSRNEVAERFGQATHKPYTVGHVPIGVIRLLRGLMKPFHPGLARVMQFTLLSEDRDSQARPEDTIARFGLKPTTIDAFIQSVTR